MEIHNRDTSEIEQLKQRIAELEAQLHQSEQKLDTAQTDVTLFQALIDSLPQNVFCKDLNGNYTFANRQYCRTQGLSLTDILGKTNFDIHPDHLANKYRADDQHVISTQQLIELEEEYQPSDRPKFTVKVIKAPLFEASGKVIGTIGVFWDITHEKIAEEQRLSFTVEKERIRILQQFIEGALHEFRTPLSTVQVHLYMLKQAVSAELQEHIQAIEQQSDDILQLVEALSTISQLDHHIATSTVSVNINELIHDVCTKKSAQLNKSGLVLNLSLPANIPSIGANPQELSIALTCLLDNAVHHTPSGGTINISSTFTEHNVCIAIQDTGSGISPENIPHIFKRFFREDTARTTRGFGLGLPIAKTIVERHNGHIKVDSVVGQGSTFTIVLPIH